MTTITTRSGSMLADWAQRIARQAWPECSVQVTQMYGGRTSFVIAPPDGEDEAFCVSSDTAVVDIEQRISEAAAHGAVRYLRGAQSALDEHSAVVERIGFDHGYEEGIRQGERRGRAAQTRHALDIIAGYEQNLDEARGDQIVLAEVRKIMASSSDDSFKLITIQAILDGGIAASDEMQAHPSHISR